MLSGAFVARKNTLLSCDCVAPCYAQASEQSAEARRVAQLCSLVGGRLIVPPHDHLELDCLNYKSKHIFESTQVPEALAHCIAGARRTVYALPCYTRRQNDSILSVRIGAHRQ